VQKLRKECPWDREQTLDSIKPNILEEAYELVDAITKKNPEKIREEIGDMMLQAIFSARIAEDEGMFPYESVLHELSEKLISKHPHVFGATKGTLTKDEVLKRWTKGKKSMFENIPRNLPSILMLDAMIKRMKRLGLTEGVKDMLVVKLKDEINNIGKGRQTVGSMLKIIVNACCLIDIVSDTSAELHLHKFVEKILEEADKKKVDGRLLLRILELNRKKVKKYKNE
jgi:uncharacterized protein YabN with tetrapyrrole methylase and pyrophosphatase domain